MKNRDMPSPDKLWSLKEIGRATGVCYPTLLAHIKSGKLKVQPRDPSQPKAPWMVLHKDYVQYLGHLRKIKFDEADHLANASGEFDPTFIRFIIGQTVRTFDLVDDGEATAEDATEAARWLAEIFDTLTSIVQGTAEPHAPGAIRRLMKRVPENVKRRVRAMFAELD